MTSAGHERTLLIVPAYNEEATVTDVVAGIRNAGYDYVVVNDGSTDATLDICRERNLNVIDLPVNLGLAGAFQTGMIYAWRRGYDYAVQFDADKQHRPEYIAELVEAAENHDIVIGSRFVTEKKPLTMRMAGSRLISLAIRLTTGRKLKDPTSGMRCFNRRMIALLANGINVGPEPDTLAYLIRSANARVTEVQVKVDERSAGKSYLNIKTSIVYMARILLSVLLIQFFRRRIEPEKKNADSAYGSSAVSAADSADVTSATGETDLANAASTTGAASLPNAASAAEALTGTSIQREAAR